ncbi:hypothetical protein EV201_1093 [Ancylomarina subtilis]|uniref:Uncharacterized protein n=1 Tax=Ancylomarina subtilis TaxID=1639035 RepID=A0A4V2FT22_9BACT|nr:hypothetical protein EV201_1093 [Ancylomarina subtilis]
MLYFDRKAEKMPLNYFSKIIKTKIEYQYVNKKLTKETE